jgi:curved DNA-binding protein CbpA
VATPYEVLGLDPSASAEDIKDAFRRLALELHPDRNPGDEDKAARFKQVNAAHQLLGDPELRSQYDRHGEGWVDPLAPPPDPAPDAGAIVRDVVLDVVEQDVFPEVVQCFRDVRAGGPVVEHLKSAAGRMLGRFFQRVGDRASG